ncbi:MAG: MBL fold metallo-hydrolase [Proteobacteria bacterium]|nr:MBL fold metallo-hydrolase [Pseudomonadota bacterium]MBU4296237.1 MBL fold metallo-hydrolase [Pseudomonadota bacterium]MCG2746405.1 MBL fold metallo-hydrolase [Desulfobulbaceae bacterium]
MQTNVIIRQTAIGPYKVNTYLLACAQTKKAVLIDPGGEAERIVKMVRDEGVEPVYILNTHGHADHVLANQKLQMIFSVPVCMHEADDIFFAAADVREKSEKELGLPAPAPADIRLQDGQVLEVGNLRIKVIHTPGHTPGSVCFLVEGNLFTGDTLFVGDVGRTDLTGGSLDTLINSLKEKVIVLPAETIIWPGHDYGETPTSTVGREMLENLYITDFILAE